MMNFMKAIKMKEVSTRQGLANVCTVSSLELVLAGTADAAHVEVSCLGGAQNDVRLSKKANKERVNA